MAKRRSTADVEARRLKQSAAREENWKRWGTYLSERQWGTVREDYSSDGSVWDYFSHEQSRSRAYRWGEDGLLGWTDRQCRMCFSIALWNGKDHILKERLFGLTGNQGNHGEDVKELYYYLDATPTHSYCKGLYKYPQAAFPYDELVRVNQQHGIHKTEYELLDTGVFDEDRYFDVQVEYAKAGPDDVLVRITATNRGPERAPLHLLPTFWYRNTWVWGCTHEGCWLKPRMQLEKDGRVLGDHTSLGRFIIEVDEEPGGGQPPLLFTDNETNVPRVFGGEPQGEYTKDAFHDYVISGDAAAVNPEQFGTKMAAHYQLELDPQQAVTIRCRFRPEEQAKTKPFGITFKRAFQDRIDEADRFYRKHLVKLSDPDEREIARQSLAGLLWSKQFYHMVVEDWLDGDPNQPAPPASRQKGRNNDWRHLFNRDVISMPDKWEYPWYAAWDLAFHVIPIARIDPDFAKKQLLLMLREWYMHPNGQIPAYEFAFGDVNPPVHAWACWRIYKMTAPRGQRDIQFLEQAFHKLLINFTWWVNRKDLTGRHVFSGGFLGMDNIGVFDRSQPLPDGRELDQADGTAWVAFFCGTMLSIALELAGHNRAYSDVASKFFEHFVAICDAMNTLGGTGLWDEDEGFYYDQIRCEGHVEPMRVRSMVGLLPIIAAEILEEKRINKLPGFKKRMDWFLKNRQDLAKHVSYMCRMERAHDCRLLLAIPSEDRLRRVLKYMLDENEFLSPFGVRSLSKYHEANPYELHLNGTSSEVRYQPGESDTSMFGGNSNWRGPIWFPVNFLLIEALERYHHFYGNDFKIEFPTGSGKALTLKQIARLLSQRLSRLFMPGSDGRRPAHGEADRYASDPAFKDLMLFYEYFHGDTGEGLGASHQTGWTSLVYECLRRCGKK